MKYSLLVICIENYYIFVVFENKNVFFILPFSYYLVGKKKVKKTQS